MITFVWVNGEAVSAVGVCSTYRTGPLNWVTLKV